MKIGVSIIEDDASVREFLGLWLKQSPDFRWVSEYGNAESAIARLPQDKPDVVLVDINLSGQSGIHCVRQLKPVMPRDSVPHAHGLQRFRSHRGCLVCRRDGLFAQAHALRGGVGGHQASS